MITFPVHLITSADEVDQGDPLPLAKFKSAPTWLTLTINNQRHLALFSTAEKALAYVSSCLDEGYISLELDRRQLLQTLENLNAKIQSVVLDFDAEAPNHKVAPVERLLAFARQAR